MKESNSNIASTLETLAREIPEVPAVIVPWRGERISFRELHRESDLLASGLEKSGLKPGDRVLMMVPFGINFISLTFALFKIRAVPVLIDPGLGKKNTLQCVHHAEPHAFIGVPLAHAVAKLFPKPFRTVKTKITVGRRWFWGGATLGQIRRQGPESFAPAPTKPEDPAAILFTSGSTGPSKGVLYTHGMFSHQVEILRSCFGIQKGDIDLPTFPLFGLFGVRMGMTGVIPQMDFTRPAKVDPENIIRPIHEYKITNSFGSPALWNTVSRYCLEKNIRLPSLKRILMAGAPVPGDLLDRFKNILDDSAKIYTPYGATEALPVTIIDRKEIIEATWKRTQQGHGTCVGKPVAGLTVKIIEISDAPILNWDENLEVKNGAIGEIIAQGPWVTRRYFNRDDATRLAKIPDGENFWRRMGDVGYMDDQGRLWFCGRKNHRVVTQNGTLYTIPCEAIFNKRPDVRRSALVGVGPRGRQTPVIIIEPENISQARSKKAQEKIRTELLALGAEHEPTRNIKEILFHPEFPVDIRHNAKIFREKLAEWATAKIGKL